MLKKVTAIIMIMGIFSILLFGCDKNMHNPKDIPLSDESNSTNILVAAAASMEKAIEEVNDIFMTEYTNIKVDTTFDASGKLQLQIEEGLEADVFLPAAKNQMDALEKQGYMDPKTIKELLQNKVVLIVPNGIDSKIHGFDDILNGDIIAIGDPKSVPAGHYAKEVLEYLGVYEKVLEKVSFGTNVTQILNWVAEGSSEVGIVYETDAASTNKVKVIDIAPEGSLQEEVIYPIGMVASSKNKEAAQLYIDFLQREMATNIFEKYGFRVK